MKTLIEIIDGVTQYGLGLVLEQEEKKRKLEEKLVQLYAIYFQIAFEFDKTEYPAFDRSIYPKVPEHVKHNFPDFSFYKVILNPNEFSEEAEIGTGDAVDDLSDIIYDLLEIKWRYENNSEADALWFFSFIFPAHTQQHLINLLGFIKALA